MLIDNEMLIIYNTLIKAMVALETEEKKKEKLDRY